MAATLLNAGPLFGGHRGLTARLEAFFPPARFSHGIVPARLTRDGWKRLLHRTPFVGLGWTGMAPDPASGRTLRGDVQWTVFLADRAESSPAARLLGSVQQPGIYGMTQVACACLQGFTIRGEADAPSGPVGTVSVTDVANLTVDGWDDEATTLVGINLKIGFGLADEFSAAALDDFQRVGVTWQFDGVAGDAASDTIIAGST